MRFLPPARGWRKPLVGGRRDFRRGWVTIGDAVLVPKYVEKSTREAGALRPFLAGFILAFREFMLTLVFSSFILTAPFLLVDVVLDPLRVFFLVFFRVFLPLFVFLRIVFVCERPNRLSPKRLFLVFADVSLVVFFRFVVTLEGCASLLVMRDRVWIAGEL